MDNGLPSYELVLPRTRESMGALAVASSLILATYGPEANDLMRLRIALYEICANIIEHGRTKVDDDPEESREEIVLVISFGDGEITGWIQDHCELFDPTSKELAHISDRLAARYRRGYGIYMLLQLLDRLEHEYNELGNRITFSKRIVE